VRVFAIHLILLSGIAGAAEIQPFLEKHCFECHDAETAKGDVSLENWAALEVETRNLAMDQIAFGEMPPKKKPQPNGVEREQIVAVIEAELIAAGHTPDLREKLKTPEYGNYVDHETLFDGSITAVPSTSARMWKRSPQIFDSLIDRGAGFTRPGRYGARAAALTKIKQPFTIEERAGIVDYAAITMADSATLGTMMRNADSMVGKMLEGAIQEVHVRVHGETPEDELPKDKNGKPIRPKFHQTPEEFGAIVLAAEPPDEATIDTAIAKMFAMVIEREPSPEQTEKYRTLIQNSIAEAGNAEGLRLGLLAIAISPAAIYRSEFGQGEVDEHGRQLLGSAELVFAISYALTDQKPDEQLLVAAKSGNLATREDIEREVARIWDDAETEKPRVLRFFHEFFGYHKAPTVFKDDARFEGDYRKVPEMLVADADALVMHIVDEDRDVFAQLLTTGDYFVAHSGNNEEERTTNEALQQFYEYYKDLDWKKFPYAVDKEHMAHVRSIHKMFTHANGNVTKRWMSYLAMCDKNGINHLPMADRRNYITAYNLKDTSFDYPVEQPFALDPENRIGILMHPAWLLAQSLNLDNDPVRRGKWVRERLLAGSAPELPITVDASIPEAPHSSLRERFGVIREDNYCWRCHDRMNPLGMPFESFDDFGRHRRGTEQLLAKGKTKPVNSSGMLVGTGDPALDGEVEDPIDMLKRIARSDRARQSFVRHAFRYWMGRNESLSDSATLIAADQAYLENEGSFRALVISLLTSDSFLYRKTIR
jgi:hypothetical protein